MKKFRILNIVFLIMLFSSGLFGQNSSNYKFQPESKLWLEGTSTLHDFTIKAKEMTSSLIIQELPDSSGFKVSSLQLIIPVKKLDSEKESMNENMQEAMEAEDNPNIIFNLTTVPYVSFNNSDSVRITANGSLTIAGVKKIINLGVDVIKKDKNKFEFKGERKLLMTDYKIDPPTMFLGTIKTGNEITVKFDLILIK